MARAGTPSNVNSLLDLRYSGICSIMAMLHAIPAAITKSSRPLDLALIPDRNPALSDVEIRSHHVHKPGWQQGFARW
jgi:hypothetical protein